MADFPLVPTDSSGADLADALARADWSGFDTERDLTGLREALRDLEEREGVTEAHRIATAALRERGAKLSHPFGHELAVTSHALSPDGRYLAVGDPPDFFVTEEGTLQVWEVASGRCVSAFSCPEGLGWHGYGDCVQWSADSRRLVMNFCTSLIGRWDPFAPEPELDADVSAGAVNGASRPVGFVTLPDADAVFVASGDWEGSAGSGMWGGLSTIDENYYYADYGDKQLLHPRWLHEPSEPVRKLLDGGLIDPESMLVSADGSRLWGVGVLMARDDSAPSNPVGAAFCVDLTARRLEWVRPVDFAPDDNPLCCALSFDERRLACRTGTSVLILDPADGEPLAEYPGLPYDSDGAPRLAWEAAGPRLAEFTSAAVRIHPADGEPHQLDVALPPLSTLDQVDLFPFAWSPDGSRFALLTANATVEIWDATAAPKRLNAIAVPDGLTGLFWGAGGVLVAAGGDRLHFVRTDGQVLNDVPAARTPREEGDEDYEIGEVDFTLDDGTEVLVLSDDAVIAPPHRAAELDAVLSWSIDRRFAWPLRWGMPDVFADVDAARARADDARR